MLLSLWSLLFLLVLVNVLQHLSKGVCLPFIIELFLLHALLYIQQSEDWESDMLLTSHGVMDLNLPETLFILNWYTVALQMGECMVFLSKNLRSSSNYLTIGCNYYLLLQKDTACCIGCVKREKNHPILFIPRLKQHICCTYHSNRQFPKSNLLDSY